MAAEARRYEAMTDAARARQVRKILEVGTCRGERAAELIRAAQKTAANPADVMYWGFDLFTAPPVHELTSRKQPLPREVVHAELAPLGARVVLVEGDTKTTLPEVAPELPVMDLVFIDGGHSEETIRSDWAALQPVVGPDTVVFLDDYWNLPQGGGSKPLVDKLADDPAWSVQLMEPVDEFRRAWGTLRTRLAQVRRAPRR